MVLGACEKFVMISYSLQEHLRQASSKYELHLGLRHITVTQRVIDSWARFFAFGMEQSTKLRHDHSVLVYILSRMQTHSALEAGTMYHPRTLRFISKVARPIEHAQTNPPTGKRETSKSCSL